MSGFLLDTSALLALRDNEQGANRVSELLSDGSPCYGSFMTLMEVFYRVWKDEGEAAAREAYADCLNLPMVWIHESPEILQRAAAIKATHPLSVADAWIAATAWELEATLVHKDPEFEQLPELLQACLPYK
ncbi:putative nucleic acid-binding protein [Nitrosomonas nitrosa]|uniref:Ribonuclease VapC n=2 Tax=Nitrosomonas nitrosa TaxID=52442 RepID=A0A1I4S967_9PROT|nr:PIN domain-containing protein [Nitrosomonas nitrosa]PTQ98401.1 putative nucleic acid-binding protein [Nitrosomonas nitrosa]CAE6491254.1 Ribonuclease VapC [Nitrosomonas nitrosa]SFM60813.1 Predicted nucleic acid-binding protein, contains PIN domain [Nitrosomonas nitrosa]HNP50167.1 PIN domain-containing protein [Nitrosomonas nitrosa]